MNAQSQWRVELAQKLAAPYVSRVGLRMLLLSGSVARDCADAYSDLDLIAIWDELDPARARSILALRLRACERAPVLEPLP